MGKLRKGTKVTAFGIPHTVRGQVANRVFLRSKKGRIVEVKRKSVKKV